MSFVGEEIAAFSILDVDGRGRVIQHVLEQAVLLLNLSTGFTQFGDIQHDTDKPGRLLVVVLDGMNHRHDFAFGSIRLHQSQLICVGPLRPHRGFPTGRDLRQVVRMDDLLPVGGRHFCRQATQLSPGGI